MTPARTRAIVVAALLCGVAVVFVALGTDHNDAKEVWAVLAPTVGWSFIGTGLYAHHRRPDNRTGALMVALGFAWFVFNLQASNNAVVMASVPR